jgi:hypothetical protein
VAAAFLAEGAGHPRPAERLRQSRQGRAHLKGRRVRRCIDSAISPLCRVIAYEIEREVA